MYKIFNLLLLIIICLFLFNIYKYYSSNNNINKVKLNRSNIDKIVKNKILEVTILEIDTDKGHDSFLLDEPELDYVIKGFFDSNYGKINE